MKTNLIPSGVWRVPPSLWVCFCWTQSYDMCYLLSKRLLKNYCEIEWQSNFFFQKKNLALNLLAIFPTELFQTDLRIDFNHWQLFSKWYFRQSYTTWWHCKNYKYQFIAFWLFRSICSKNYGFCLVTYVLFSTPFHFYKKHWNCSSKLAVLQKNEKQISSKPPIYYRTDAKCLVWFKYHPLDLSAIIWMNFS